MTDWRCLKICVINPVDDQGVYNVKDAEVIDYIVVDLYDLGFLFVETLWQHLAVLFRRNDILPED